MKTFIICVAGLLVHVASAALQCEIIRIKTCAQRYKVAVKDGKNHCERLQTMIDCLAQDFSCADITITSFRFWMLQMGLMDKIMGNCPDLETDDLRTFTTKILNKRPDLVVDSVDMDSSSPCARKIHNRCVEYYVKTLKRTRQICTAVQALNLCYSKGIVDDNCQADIIEHFADILQKVAPRVINILKNNLPKVCEDWV
ncbi:uncharacterized protein LOC116302448 [Actinia tenebrosa]|uniref:Uncharacterized protein LOC116302448 n=1 Tax=Actinia tenebrosa TaxID=6105 RepID=A0A6P8ILE3_ACTTE|nr:uncharacterized protein LOC116302448 [Actinia tenebrosa]